MKVIAVYPYSDILLNSLKESIKIGLGSYALVGKKAQIIEKCYQNNIRAKDFIIYDIDNDFDVIDFCINSLNDGSCDYIIFDDFPMQYQEKILKKTKDKEIGNLDIIDLPSLRHFVFVSNYTKNHNIDFEDKKTSILQAYEFMQKLDIKKINVALICNICNKTDILEANIISMILKDYGLERINIYDSFNIYNLFLKNNSINIYKNNINLLIFRNYEASRIFIDTLNAFTVAKIGSFLIGDYIGIDLKNMQDDNKIIFALMVLNKIHNTKEVLNALKTEVI